MQVTISVRHGNLGEPLQQYIRDKAERLLRFFERLTAIAVTVDLQQEQPEVEVVVSAEHRHDFVARDRGLDVIAAVDQVVQKMEQQLRKYKERIQDHRRTPAHGDVPSGETTG